MEMSAQLHVSATLPPVLLDRRPRGSHSLFGPRVEDKFPAPAWNPTNPGRPARSLVTVLTELFWLQEPVKKMKAL